MDDKEILRKCIEKAVKGGLDIRNTKYGCIVDYDDDILDWTSKEREQYEVLEKSIGLSDIIFDHSFAKAFWGDLEYDSFIYESGCEEMWQYHLQKLALSENRLKYLAKFL